MTQVQFLTITTIETLSRRVAPYGITTSPIERCYGYDIRVDFPTYFEGRFITKTHPFWVQLDGRSFATLVSGARHIKEECEEQADPMVNDNEWILDVHQCLAAAARFLLKTLIEVLDESAA